MASISPLSDCASTRLHRLVRLVDDIYRKHLLRIGLSESQMTILLTLSHEGAMLQSALGKALHLQRSTVTRNLDRLVQNGIVEKKGPATRPEVHLTKKGKAVVKKVKPAWNAALKEVNALLGSSGSSAIGVLERRLLQD